MHPDKDSPVGRPVVTVVKETDIPVVTHLGQEVEQGARALRKLESINDLVVHIRGVTTDHMTQM